MRPAHAVASNLHLRRRARDGAAPRCAAPDASRVREGITRIPPGRNGSESKIPGLPRAVGVVYKTRMVPPDRRDPPHPSSDAANGARGDGREGGPLAIEALHVDLDELAKRGLPPHHVAADLPVAWQAHAMAQTDATVREPGRVILEITPMTDERVLVRGELKGRFVVPCGRCLDDAHVDADTEIVATFVPAAKHAALLAAAVERARAAAGDDDDVEDYDDISLEELPYSAPNLDLEDLVREEFVVAYPMRALCERGEACRGLCSNCGAELNPLPHSVRRCPQCGNPIPETPAADLEAISGQGDGAAAEAVSATDGPAEIDDPFEPAWKKALRTKLRAVPDGDPEGEPPKG